MTEKLFEKDRNQTRFTAQIIDVIREKKTFNVLLDRTCFYPEGGGQPADKGTIAGIPVIDVQKDKESGGIYHTLKKHPGEGTVEAEVDAAWRHDYQQQHTGQHILSAALWKTGNYKTVSVHMGVDYTTIEIETPDISEQEIQETEKIANRAVLDNLPVQYVHTDDTKLGDFELRRPTTRKGDIRLVTIGENFDCVACGGVHLDQTGGAGLIKWIATEKIRGNTRLAFKIGDRATADYHQKIKTTAQLRSILGTNDNAILRKTESLVTELAETKRKTSALENRLAEAVTAELLQKSRQPENSSFNLITHTWDAEEDSLVKKVLKNLLKEKRLAVCFINRLPERLMWSIACTADMEFPFNEFKNELLPLIGGKGGGRPPMWMGTGLNKDGAQEFLQTFQRLAAEHIKS